MIAMGRHHPGDRPALVQEHPYARTGGLGDRGGGRNDPAAIAAQRRAANLGPLAASMRGQPPTTGDRRRIVALIFAAGVVAGAIYALGVLLTVTYGGFP